MTSSDQSVEDNTLRINISGMKRPTERGSFSDVIRDLWNSRTLIYEESRSNILTSNRRNKLGSIWVILNPLLNGIIYLVVFGLVFQLGEGSDNYIGFLIIGVFIFQMTSSSISSSADSIFSGRKSAISMGLPLAMLPIMKTTERWLVGFPSYVVMLLMVLLVPPLENLSLLALLFVPLIIIQAVFTTGLSLLAAHFVAKVHDLKQVISIAVKGWMFGSGVMFSTEKLTEVHPAFIPFVEFNPMHHILTIARDVLLYNTLPPMQSWITVVAWSVTTCGAGLLLIWSNQGRYDFGIE